MTVGVCMPWHVCEGERTTCESHSSPPSWASIWTLVSALQWVPLSAEPSLGPWTFHFSPIFWSYISFPNLPWSSQPISLPACRLCFTDSLPIKHLYSGLFSSLWQNTRQKRHKGRGSAQFQRCVSIMNWRCKWAEQGNLQHGGREKGYGMEQPRTESQGHDHSGPLPPARLNLQPFPTSITPS